MAQNKEPAPEQAQVNLEKHLKDIAILLKAIHSELILTSGALRRIDDHLRKVGSI